MLTASARGRSFRGKMCIDMERQRIFLPEWEWECVVFYDAWKDDVPEILHSLQEIGCERRHFFRAKNLLLAGGPNAGMTVSSFGNRQSVMVVGRATSTEQFQNTFDHEKGHLARHICMADEIDPYGEEAQYIAGEIGQKLWSTAKDYICEC